MTPSEAIREIEDTFDKKLTPKQTSRYLRFLGKFNREDISGITEKAIEECRYLPRISQLNDAVRDLLVLRPERKRRADPGCPECRGTGWRYVVGYCKFTKQEEAAVERCNCLDDRGSSKAPGEKPEALEEEIPF